MNKEYEVIPEPEYVYPFTLTDEEIEEIMAQTAAEDALKYAEFLEEKRIKDFEKSIDNYYKNQLSLLYEGIFNENVIAINIIKKEKRKNI